MCVNIYTYIYIYNIKQALKISISASIPTCYYKQPLCEYVYYALYEICYDL